MDKIYVWSAGLFLVTGLFLGGQPAGAVLISKGQSDPNVSKNSKLVSDTEASLTDTEAAKPSGGQMKVRLRLKPANPSAVNAAYEQKPAKDVPQHDPYALGKSKTVTGADIEPEGTSPVKQTVSGPPNKLLSYPAKMRSTGPTQFNVSGSAKASNAQIRLQERSTGTEV